MRRMKSGGIAFLLLALSPPARAAAPSVIGGKLLPTGTSGHHFGMGLPSVFYEWWNGGDQMDWALHAGLVYEDWSGEFSDVDVGLDLEVPMRFHIAQRGAADVAFRLAPGLLLGDHDHGRFDRTDDNLVIGMRPEVGVLVGIELSDIVNLVTGGVVPFTILIDDHDTDNDVIVVIPLMPRIGVEVQPFEALVPWALLEVGPTVGIGGGESDVEAGVRFWLGVTWYP